MTPLAEAYLDPEDERELGWYLCYSDGALGLHGFNPATVTGGSGNVPTGPPQGQVDAVDKARRVERRLLALTRPQQRVLVAAYGPPLPAGAQDAWGWLPASFRSRLRPQLLLLIAERQSVSRTTLKAWHVALQGEAGEAKAEAKKKLEVLRQDAEVALVRACRGYETTGEVRARRRRGVRR